MNSESSKTENSTTAEPTGDRRQTPVSEAETMLRARLTEAVGDDGLGGWGKLGMTITPVMLGDAWMRIARVAVDLGVTLDEAAAEILSDAAYGRA